MYRLGEYQTAQRERLKQMTDQRFFERMQHMDHTLWTDEPKDCADKLGWLWAPTTRRVDLQRIRDLTQKLLQEGITHVVLLGMGGSSLAPQMFSSILGSTAGYLQFTLLDTTDPGAILDCARSLELAQTVFVVSTKSGGTIETLSLFKFFHGMYVRALGATKAGEHFVAITDSGKQLEKLAGELGLRDCFINDPQVGGRYSALTYFGLVPAGLIGVDLERLLEPAARLAVDPGPGLELGAALGELALAGRDKLTLLLSPQLAALGDWLEQLIAESTGKHGQGILPIIHEPIAAVDEYGSDRVFVRIGLAGDVPHQALCSSLVERGHPLISFRLHDVYQLGEQIMLWELATAATCHVLGVNPFDQPDVESAKAVARELTAEYIRTESLESADKALPPLLTDEAQISAVLSKFAQSCPQGGYLALQAYVDPRPQTYAALNKLRGRLFAINPVATTASFGPRYLHSTGQLHKGGPNNGVFVQIISRAELDVPIPDEPGGISSNVSFAVLKHAQAMGDCRALLKCGRHVLRIGLGPDPATQIERIAAAIGNDG
ncbi:MAG: hypothetical protein P9M14_10965 [Candidatus Alcyoniella australis]|nr:hypothetical protein [Candidatus Alcyoniella australis]